MDAKSDRILVPAKSARGSISLLRGDFDEHVDHWFGGQTGNGGAAEVLDPSKELVPEAGAEMLAFLGEGCRPEGIIIHDSNGFLNRATKAFIEIHTID